MDDSSQAPNLPKGRRKVKLEKMKNKSHLQVTFSKRRYGLFKKASELCTLTGCEIGIIVHSPGNKVLSFGHPSVHKIIDACFPIEGREGMWARNNTPLIPPSLQMRYDEMFMTAQRKADVKEKNTQLSLLETQMEMEKQTAVLLKDREKNEIVGHPPLKDMTESELLELGASLNVLKQSITAEMANISNVPVQMANMTNVPMKMANPCSGLWDIPNFNAMGEMNPINEMNPMNEMNGEGFGCQGF